MDLRRSSSFHDHSCPQPRKQRQRSSVSDGEPIISCKALTPLQSVPCLTSLLLSRTRKERLWTYYTRTSNGLGLKSEYSSSIVWRLAWSECTSDFCIVSLSPVPTTVTRQLETLKYKDALALIGNLLTELKRLDDKLVLTEVHLLESRVYRATGNLPKSKVEQELVKIESV